MSAAALPVYRLPFPDSGLARIGVVADSHIPDRMRALPPEVFEALRGVHLVVHAGDICSPGVLTDLARIAPVVAVRGNRDLLYRANWRLPLARLIETGGVRIGLTHGHGGLKGYLKEKLHYYTVGYRLEEYLAAVPRLFRDVQAIVFGHSHHPANQARAGVLLFNPGSVGPDYKATFGASVGVLTVQNGAVRGDVIPLGVGGR